jgi:hypothetical protein
MFTLACIFTLAMICAVGRATLCGLRGITRRQRYEWSIALVFGIAGWLMAVRGGGADTPALAASSLSAPPAP